MEMVPEKLLNKLSKYIDKDDLMGLACLSYLGNKHLYNKSFDKFHVKFSNDFVVIFSVELEEMNENPKNSSE